MTENRLNNLSGLEHGRKIGKSNLKRFFLALTFLIPGLLFAEPVVLVDAVPTGAMFLGVTPIRLAFQDAISAKPKEITEGLNSAIANILPAAAQQGMSFICLLSSPGDDPIKIHIDAAKTDLKLSRTHTAVFALFYRDGHKPKTKLKYSFGSPEKKTAQASADFKKISLPPGGSTAGWIYFNLPRIQQEAEKSKSPFVFLKSSGAGTAVPVIIPGLKEPLMVPDDQSIFTASWYIDPKLDAAHSGAIFGHPMDPASKTGATSPASSQTAAP